MSRKGAAAEAIPVFIVGPLRSGTTLLRVLMNHHPQLNMFGEFEGAVSQSELDAWPNLDKYYDFIRTDRQMRAMNLCVDQSLSYEDLVHSFFKQMSDRNPLPYAGASIHSRIDRLPDLWPEAKYINLIRDPRDVARSCIGMGWVGNVFEGSKFWLKVERHRKQMLKKLSADQVITVRYEDLVAKPEESLECICRFLSIEYDDRMLNIEEDTTYERPSSQYSNQWKRKLNADEIRQVESLCQEEMKALNYELMEGGAAKVGLFESLYLKVHSRFYRARFSISRWGVGLWIQHLLSQRLGVRSWFVAVKLKTNEIDRRYIK